ncbi:hypothetical protein CHUAL_007300 [Chamberlinius hualienensis]
MFWFFVMKKHRYLSKRKVITGGICQLVEESLGDLYGVESLDDDALKKGLIRQARDLLVCHYFGSLLEFQREFLQPAATLLRILKTKERGKRLQG